MYINILIPVSNFGAKRVLCLPFEKTKTNKHIVIFPVEICENQLLPSLKKWIEYQIMAESEQSDFPENWDSANGDSGFEHSFRLNPLCPEKLDRERYRGLRKFLKNYVTVFDIIGKEYGYKNLNFNFADESRLVYVKKEKSKIKIGLIADTAEDYIRFRRVVTVSICAPFKAELNYKYNLHEFDPDFKKLFPESSETIRTNPHLFTSISEAETLKKFYLTDSHEEDEFQFIKSEAKRPIRTSLRCQYCLYKFSNSANKEKHIRTQHLNASVYEIMKRKDDELEIARKKLNESNDKAEAGQSRVSSRLVEKWRNECSKLEAEIRELKMRQSTYSKSVKKRSRDFGVDQDDVDLEGIRNNPSKKLKTRIKYSPTINVKDKPDYEIRNLFSKEPILVLERIDSTLNIARAFEVAQEEERVESESDFSFSPNNYGNELEDEDVNTEATTEDEIRETENSSSSPENNINLLNSLPPKKRFTKNGGIGRKSKRILVYPDSDSDDEPRLRIDETDLGNTSIEMSEISIFDVGEKEQIECRYENAVNLIESSMITDMIVEEIIEDVTEQHG